MWLHGNIMYLDQSNERHWKFYAHPPELNRVAQQRIKRAIARDTDVRHNLPNYDVRQIHTRSCS